MKIDPITQYILEQEPEPTNTQRMKNIAKRAGISAIKPAARVVRTVKRRIFDDKVHADCMKLKSMAVKYGRGDGQCNGAKHQYYSVLARLCHAAYELQDAVEKRDTGFKTPSGKREAQNKAEELRQKVLDLKEKIENTRAYMEEACTQEIEDKVKDRMAEKEKRKKLFARKNKAKK